MSEGGVTGHGCPFTPFTSGITILSPVSGEVQTDRPLSSASKFQVPDPGLWGRAGVPGHPEQ